MPFQEDEVMIGHGKTLHYGDTDATQTTKVDGTIEINLPESELGEAEITNDDSPEFTKDFQPGMYDPGEVTVTYRYTRTQFTALETLYGLARVAATRAAATKWWKLTFPDGSIAKFKGFMKYNRLPAAGQEDTVNAEFGIRVRSKITWTPAAST